MPLESSAAERAFAGADLDLRYHFNLPDTVQPTSLLSVTFDANNLDGNGADPRFGGEVCTDAFVRGNRAIARVKRPSIRPTATYQRSFWCKTRCRGDHYP